jgi:uncharacterized RmlC-like cupin family protein
VCMCGQTRAQSLVLVAPQAFHRNVRLCTNETELDALSSRSHGNNTGRRDLIVEAGDVLYMPQGTPHRCVHVCRFTIIQECFS